MSINLQIGPSLSSLLLTLLLVLFNYGDTVSGFSPSRLSTITIPQRKTTTQKIPEEQSNNDKISSYPSPLYQLHVYQVLSQEEAGKALQMAQEYNDITNCWSTKDTERHKRYSTADFCVEECDILSNYLESIQFEQRMFQLISELYDVDTTDLEFQDLFCAHYRGNTEKNDHQDTIPTVQVMDHLAFHRDGSLISFTIVLCDSESYTGGGTEFDALKGTSDGTFLSNGVVRVHEPGQAVIHCGKILHGAHLVTSGARTTLTGFVEVDGKCIRPEVMAQSCKEFGRQDNAAKRLERQIQKTDMLDSVETNCNVFTSGWNAPKEPFVRGTSQLCTKFVPAFSTVVKRGNEENRRLRNLDIEDVMLRTLLLPREERTQFPSDIFDLSAYGGDITIL